MFFVFFAGLAPFMKDRPYRVPPYIILVSEATLITFSELPRCAASLALLFFVLIRKFPHKNSIDNITFIQLHSRSDYRTKIKINPKCNIVPDRPNWAPLLIIWKRNNITNTNFFELLLELGCVTCMISTAPANWVWK